MFVFGKGSYSTAGVIVLAVLGLVSIAISREWTVRFTIVGGFFRLLTVFYPPAKPDSVLGE